MKRTNYLLLLAALATILATGCKDDDMKTDAASVDELLARWAPKSEEFTGLTYTSAKGFKIDLAGPFYSLATGAEVSGTPVSTITVYHDTKEMLFGGLQTVSYGEMLSTSGSFKIKTTINGEAVRAHSMYMRFPALDPDLPMELYSGSSDTGVYNWAAFNQGFIFAEVFFSDSAYADSPLGDYVASLTASLQSNSWYPNGTLSINCDYYPNTGLPLTDLQLSVAQLADGASVLSTGTKLYFLEEHTIMNGYGLPSRYRNVPIGHQAKAIAIVIDTDGNLYYGIIDLTIEPDGQYLVQLEPTSEEDLRAALMGL